MSVIDEVKQRTDIVEVVSQYASLTKAGRTFRALCPFHSENHPSFFVYPEQQSWHCFGACNTGGDVFSFIMKKEGSSFGEALRLLAERAGVTIPSRAKPEADKEKNDRLYQANQAATLYFHDLLLSSPAGERARNYIAQRGLKLKAVTDFQLGYSLNSWEALKQHLMDRGYTESELIEAGLIIKTDEGKSYDRFRNMLMFPICDGRGRTTGFGARVLDDSLPKYINSPQTPVFDKSSQLYGINLAREAIRQQDRAVIVEGYMDTISAHQNGFNNVIASMGTSVTEKQISSLKRLSKNVIFALDADAAGEEATLRGVNYENILDAEVKVIILPQGKDPDDVIREDAQAWQQLLDEALPIIDYIFNLVSSELDLNTAQGKSLAVDKLLPIIAEIRDIVRQAHYLQKLARLVNVSQHRLEAGMEKIKSGQTRGKPRAPAKPEAVTPALQSILANPLEEYCLALLLQHSELKTDTKELLPEYFENSENREIFTVLKQTEDRASLKDKLDTAIWEHLDYLMAKSLPENQLEQKLANCILRLREKYLRSLEIKRGAILNALAAEQGGTAAQLAKLKEQGIEVSQQLREVFSQRAKGGQGQSRFPGKP